MYPITTWNPTRHDSEPGPENLLGILEINNQCKCRKASFVQASEQFIFSWYVGRENDPTTFSVRTTFVFAFYFKFSKSNRLQCRVLNWLPLFFLLFFLPTVLLGLKGSENNIGNPTRCDIWDSYFIHLSY